MTNAEPWLSVDEIAKHLGISKETVYRWIERGRIPAHKVGKLWKFKATEVDQWVTSGEAAQEDDSQPTKTPDRKEQQCLG